MSELTHHTVTAEDGALPLTVVRGSGAGAAIVILPSAFGVGSDLEAQMIELASDARVVLALDPFFRDGRGLIPYEDMPGVMARVGGLDRERAYRDLSKAVAWTRAEHGADRVVLLGICLGGFFGLRAAADRLVDGVVTWHGSRMEQTLDRAPEVRCPLRLHFGSVDPVVPPAALEAIRAALAGHPDVEIVVHEGATHGFSQRRATSAYDARAERAGMEALRELARRSA